MQDPIAETLAHAPLALVPCWCDDAARAGADWASFTGTWDDLPLDGHMADGGAYRFRRYATLHASSATSQRATLNPHEPHFQLRDYNRVHGGVERFFAPMQPAALDNPLFARTLERSIQVFTDCERAAGRTAEWHIEAHQFRIRAAAQAPAQPTPEGMHSDGRDYVFMMLLDRQNIVGGCTTVCGRDHSVLFCATLTAPGTALFLNDREALHAVSPVHAALADMPAYRDMLVLTFCNRQRPDSLFGISTQKAVA